MFRIFIKFFFSNYISYIIKRDFQSFHFNQPEIAPDKAILLIANHFSWWDGFLLFELNRRCLNKNFHVLVTEENYQKVFFLKYLGAISLKKRSKEMLSTLNGTGRLLNDPQNLVLIFPQGKLGSNHVDEVVFEKGLTNLINASNKNYQYLFSAMFVDYFDKRKPSVWCKLKQVPANELEGLSMIREIYNKHYQESRQQHSRITI
ncbi:1-acyl-sn-glycerol-3-phosphate acyltransferase [Desertivirga brevis]|uniref:1-acyl-sn-glycerol-3-phosphate acyltransferase n=1 Tax=Desertivirga brevis TaxID=2810310 RepID=UPI001A977DC8|nr:1-acyl-sn-glycerol-3-phosphate acyltransferase [Pedobacter sp. SYSU D00873]